MKRRGVLILLVALAVVAGLMVHHRVREKSRRTRAFAEMEEARKAVAIWRTMVRPRPESLHDHSLGTMPQVDSVAIDLGTDPWGHEYLFERTGRAVTITCLGADGAPGGEGADEDIVLHWPPSEGALPR